MDLSDEQWSLVRSVVQRPSKQSARSAGREGVAAQGGRPTAESRKILNAVLWYVRTGAPWRDLPQRYGSFQTAARYFRLWVDGGQLSRIFQLLEEDVRFRASFDDFDLDEMHLNLPNGERAAWWWAMAQTLRRARRLQLYTDSETR